MRICIIGSYSGNLDEGMANVSYYLFTSLKEQFTDHNFMMFNIKEVYSVSFWKSLFKYRPEIIHFIPGPTAKGFVLVKILKILTKSKSIVSATKPTLSRSFQLISRLVAPDVVIVQSPTSEKLFRRLKYNIRFIPNGVDTRKFFPVDESKKCKIRKTYGFNCDDYIVLHVGPARKGRNQDVLEKVCSELGAKLLLIVSITNPSEEAAIIELNKTNAIVWKEYFSNIEDIYAMSDLYVFPVFDELNSIDIPLSVLEAMSCNLPVVTSNYGGLPMILNSGRGLFFAENEEELANGIKQLSRGISERIDTRTKILDSYSWESVATRVFEIYTETQRLKSIPV